MVKMPKEVVDLFNDPEASKVIATVAEDGEINVAAKGTISAVDDETVAYADIFSGKTRANLEATKKAALLAFKNPPPAGYQVKGTFAGFETSGPVYDKFAALVKDLLNLDINGVAMIKVNEVFSVGAPDFGKKIA
ncbi:pyridoxamine 5'-phosphate oxidase family protein [Methanosarcinales archaeon]|uniref:Pyridoxamine 5-phosphate oxidase n=1 Tax=Candidatus Syntropharchaeum caldarium TaxID=1838285 RepID=A0A1F2PAF8_9EURY|nr:MAG: pyridoxamine 5-phosphate oxidase [Candidatus Syntrophoarchaeum caldarius]RLG35582.1 MAG: pyridoxamine 5'-phosphate oxidase family protein [Methanosarcinales archaeon]